MCMHPPWKSSFCPSNEKQCGSPLHRHKPNAGSEEIGSVLKHSSWKLCQSKASGLMYSLNRYAHDIEPMNADLSVLVLNLRPNVMPVFVNGLVFLQPFGADFVLYL